MEILIVDDTVENIKLVSDLLGDFDTSFARSGEEALKLLEEEHFDLILLDVMMPGLDGYETCQALRQMPNSAETPVIFLTAKTDNESIIKAFASGGQDFLSKPFHTEELRARVKNQLISKRYQDRLKQQLLLEKEKSKAQALNNELESAFSQLQKDWQESFELTSQVIQNLRSKSPDLEKELSIISDTLSNFNKKID